jgi:hypothetical protein
LRFVALKTRLRTLQTKEDGGVLVFVALTLAILMVAGAFVLDLGNARQRARGQQNAADAGALAGAEGLPTSATASPTNANRYAAYYAFQTLGFNEGAPNPTTCPISGEAPAGADCFTPGGNTWVYVKTPWGPDPVADTSIAAAASNQIYVKVCADTATGLARVIGVTNVRPCRHATATNNMPLSTLPCALCIMRASGTGLTASGGARVTVDGAVVVNSNSVAPCAAQLSGSSSVTASSITIRQPGRPPPVGPCASGVSTFSPTPTHVPGLLPDPLSYLELPSHPGCPPNPAPASCNNMTLSGSNPPTTVINPGHWRNINISGSNKTLIMNPGVYVFRGSPGGGGGLTVSGSNNTIIANGVTLIFTCESYEGSSPSSCVSQAGARLALSGSNHLTLTAPTTLTSDLAKYNGLAVYYDQGNTTTALQLSGSGNLLVTGTIYAKNAQLQLSGSTGTKVLNSAVIVDHVQFSGSTDFSVDFDPAQNVRTLGLALIR